MSAEEDDETCSCDENERPDLWWMYVIGGLMVIFSETWPFCAIGASFLIGASAIDSYIYVKRI
jgi:hypothetical protein